MIFSHDFDHIYLFIGIYVLLAFNCEREKGVLVICLLLLIVRKRRKEKDVSCISIKSSPFGLNGENQLR